MQTMLVATAVLGGLGTFFGVVLAVAQRVFYVEEDPRLDVIEEMLPGSNCGACGEAGCRAFAETLIAGVHAPGACTVSGVEGGETIAAFLGVDAGQQDKRVARLHCAGGVGLARQIAEYEGYASCTAAHMVGGGGKGCAWGCLGLADCMKVCTFDAIYMNQERLPVVNVDKCTACGDCVDVCPRDLFDIMPLSYALIVQCKAPLEGEQAREICQVACDACGRCAQDAPGDLVVMHNNLPVVDYAAGGPASPTATQRCPTGAIKWVQGEQFAEPVTVPLKGIELD